MATETTAIVIYEGAGGTVEVRLDRESVWLTQRQMAELFDSSADNIGLLADSALAPAVATGTAPPTRPVLAVDTILADSKRRLRQALESYFRGDFDEAAETFDRLSRDMPTNAWVWAFLGASKYSLYAFEADETYKTSAFDAFRRAKQLRSWKGGLPEKYFSRRIRNAFNRTEG